MFSLRKNATSQDGQILLPAVAVILVFASAFVAYVQWARNALWQMRMDAAADATALSAARAEAQMLNIISVQNLTINAFLHKTRIPFTSIQAGEMAAEDVGAFEIDNTLLKDEVKGFGAQAIGVGQTVARLNGAESPAIFFPLKMDTYLIPQTVYTAIISKAPPAVWEKTFEAAYYARAWSPGKTQAQPPHKTTWMVSHNGIRSIATARLWLDADPTNASFEGDVNKVLNNGGFPPEKSVWFRDVLIQGAPPQFNARLLPDTAKGLQTLLTSRGGG